MRRKLHPCTLGRQFAFDVLIVDGRSRRFCRYLDRIQNRGSDGYLRCTPSSNQHSMEIFEIHSAYVTKNLKLEIPFICNFLKQSPFKPDIIMLIYNSNSYLHGGK